MSKNKSKQVEQGFFFNLTIRSSLHQPMLGTCLN